MGTIRLLFEYLKGRRLSCRVGSWVFMACLLAFSGLVGADHTHRTLKVGVYENPPKLFTQANGRSAGILIDLLEEIASLEGWKLEFVSCEWQACLDALATGRLDVLPDLAYSDERAQRFGFHRVPALYSWSQIYRDPEVRLESILDLQGKRLAVLVGRNGFDKLMQ